MGRRLDHADRRRAPRPGGDRDDPEIVARPPAPVEAPLATEESGDDQHRDGRRAATGKGGHEAAGMRTVDRQRLKLKVRRNLGFA
jgi:hypothetical protein